MNSTNTNRSNLERILSAELSKILSPEAISGMAHSMIALGGVIAPRAQIGDTVYTISESVDGLICENIVAIVSYDKDGIYYQFETTGMAYETECYFSKKDAEKAAKTFK